MSNDVATRAILATVFLLGGCDGAAVPPADGGSPSVTIDDAATDASSPDAGPSQAVDAGAPPVERADACAPTCGHRVCGDDGCGGTCGGCPEGEACLADGAACGCEGEAVTYVLSAPEVDWTQTRRLVVAYHQAYSASADADAPPSEWSTVVLDDAYREREVRVEGACAPDLEIVRTFVSRFHDRLGRPLVCRGEVEHVQQTDVVLPPGTGRPCAI